MKTYEDSIRKALHTLQIMDTATPMTVKLSSAKTVLFYFNKALKIPFSFAYDFRELSSHVSLIYPRDSSFRIFTWQFSLDDLAVMKQGLIQMNTKDGKPSVFPLIDRYKEMKNPLDTITDSRHWVGAMYYAIRTQDMGRRRIYTLLGIDENSILSTRKWIEILRFSKEGTPYFGGSFFSFSRSPDFLRKGKKKKERKTRSQKMEAEKIPLPERTIPLPRKSPHAHKRFMLEYAKNTIANLRYDDNLGMIIFDHLSASNEVAAERKYTYDIDGDYEGFKWEKDKWIHVPKVFVFSLENMQAPREQPLDFKKGIKAYEKMMRQK